MVESRPKAFSYLRFSSPEQRKGDSERRQLAMAKAYADAHGLQLDDSTFQDLGVSAFKGRNADEGQLGEFLELVRDGAIPQGSYLLVENLDRLSRQATRKAARVLEAIVDAGVVVVTLTDQQVYTKEKLDRDPTAFMFVVFGFMRANAESQLKSDRLRQAWGQKRKQAPNRPMTATGPGWVAFNKSKKTFEVVKGRGAVVKRIYQMAGSGKGLQTIANTLNKEQVPPFGKAKFWHRSYIGKVLDNPAAAGIFVPHINEQRDDRKRVRVPQEPIPDYYPAVVPMEVYERVRIMRAGNGKAPKSPRQNTLASLAHCPICGSTMHRINKGGRSATAYYLCSRAQSDADCVKKYVRQIDVDEALAQHASYIAGTAPSGDDTLDAKIAANDTAIQATTDAVESIIDELIQSPSPALRERLRTNEEALRGLEHERAALTEKASTIGGPFYQSRLDNLQKALTGGMEKDKANALLRQLFDGVVIDYPNGLLRLEWKQGGETTIPYGWPSQGAN